MSGYSDVMRREMAARIRYAAADGASNPLNALKGLLGLEAKDTYRAVFRKLADLVEPRECTVELLADGIGQCSECLAEHDTEGAVRYALGSLPPRFCASCGAKITEWKETEGR